MQTLSINRIADKQSTHTQLAQNAHQQDKLKGPLKSERSQETNCSFLYIQFKAKVVYLINSKKCCVHLLFLSISPSPLVLWAAAAAVTTTVTVDSIRPAAEKFFSKNLHFSLQQQTLDIKFLYIFLYFFFYFSFMQFLKIAEFTGKKPVFLIRINPCTTHTNNSICKL